MSQVQLVEFMPLIVCCLLATALTKGGRLASRIVFGPFPGFAADHDQVAYASVVVSCITQPLTATVYVVSLTQSAGHVIPHLALLVVALFCVLGLGVLVWAKCPPDQARLVGFAFESWMLLLQFAAIGVTAVALAEARALGS